MYEGTGAGETFRITRKESAWGKESVKRGYKNNQGPDLIKPDNPS